MWASGDAIMAGAVSRWYFSRNRDKLDEFLIFKAQRLNLRYHLGSSLFGAPLMGFIYVLRVVIWFILPAFRKAERFDEADRDPTGFERCMRPISVFIEVINKNGYIGVALYGLGFVESSKRIFSLTKRNTKRMKPVESISNLILIVGMFSVVLFTVIIGVLLLGELHPKETYADHSVLYAIMFFFSFIVSAVFIPTFTYAIDTVLICYCEDRERNNGSASRPYYMSDSLREFMEVHSVSMQQLNLV